MPTIRKLKKVNLKNISEIKVFKEFIFPVLAKDFLFNCFTYEEFADVVARYFILTEKQWESVLIEWEFKEKILAE